jgi:hypothetical protein
MPPITRRGFTIMTGLAAMAPGAARPADVSGPLRTELLPLARFIGTWRGEGDGEPGHSTVERSYEPALGGTYLMVRHQSVYAPQPKNPKGETHNDIGFFSFDRRRKLAVYRQFHVEGFVNQFTAPADALGADTFTFSSEAIENVPPDYRARETYTWNGGGFEEFFEIAEPGKDYIVYSRNRFTKAA